MISSDEYQVLRMVQDVKNDDIKNFDSFENLCKKGFIAFTGQRVAYVKDVGLAALEEYERAVRMEAAQTEAGKIAKRANLWSGLSFATAVLAVIVSIISLIVGVNC